MNEEEIQVIRSEILERLVQGALNILWVMLRIPELARDEDLGTRDAALLDSLSHCRLVTVDSCGIYVPIAGLEGGLDGLDNLIVRCLPCAKANGWDLGTGVESKVRGERHCE